jgi:predicted dehydrogenase/nucleoside-diphosphate-sugar epimerase
MGANVTPVRVASSMSASPRALGASLPLRVALFGCGKMGLQHLGAISTIPHARVVGIADPVLDREAVAGRVGADAHLCDDPVELLSEARPDVVHVVTPPDTHAQLARLALAAGCHVYVEKPFAPTRAEAESILELAAERGLLVCPGHQYLFERPALLARGALPGIGSLVHVESYFSFRMVRRTITPVEQVKDILPHAVYPIVEQLRAGSGVLDEPVSLVGLDVQPSGDVYALVRLGPCAGVIIVTLNGRPIEQYQHLVGTNGWLRADYVTGSLACVPGPGTGAGILLTPYRRTLEMLTRATGGLARRLLRPASYPGLERIIGRFYASVSQGSAPPVLPRSILETVGLCEQIGEALDRAEAQAEALAQARVESAPVAPLLPNAPLVLVTGGTGLLGRRVVRELREAGLPVRVVARRLPRYAMRVPGVEYATGDLARPLDAGIMRGVRFVVHCAAETQGGKADQERNSILATRHVVEAAARAQAKVIHVSSLAVLKPGRSGRELDEASPVDAGNLERGPYVWGKAESEQLAQRLGAELGVPLVVVRPGPLVDYESFQPPGRLGREIGPLFVAIGGRRNPLSVCDVGTAARVIRSHVEDFDGAPSMLNLVETPAPTRAALAARLRAERPDLRFLWLPALALRALSGPLKLAQRVVFGRDKPIDVYSAFASERYRPSLAATVIVRAGTRATEKGLPRAARRSA